MAEHENSTTDETTGASEKKQTAGNHPPAKKWPGWLLPVMGALTLLLVVLYQGGAFDGEKVSPGTSDTQKSSSPNSKRYTVTARDVPVIYRAVGTVRSRDEIEINPQITARILKVNVRSGDMVKQDDVLVELTDKDLAAQVAQAEERVEASRAAMSAAEEGIEAAKSTLALADSDMKRTQQLFEKGVAPKQQLEQATNTFRQAQAAYNQANQSKRGASAGLSGAAQALKQAQATLDYASIKSPMDGVIGERLADPGDLATPGKILMRMFDPTRLMLETPVRESLATAVRVGQKVTFTVPALDQSFAGDVREVVPAVDPGTRTFVIKIFIGEAKDLMSGMYGTLSLPLAKTEKVILVPAAAIRRTGQIESVLAVIDDVEHRMFVRSAPAAGNERRIISGLQAGMTILVPR